MCNIHTPSGFTTFPLKGKEKLFLSSLEGRTEIFDFEVGEKIKFYITPSGLTTFPHRGRKVRIVALYKYCYTKKHPLGCLLLYFDFFVRASARSLKSLAINGTAHNNNENYTLTLIVVRLSQKLVPLLVILLTRF